MSRTTDEYILQFIPKYFVKLPDDIILNIINNYISFDYVIDFLLYYPNTVSSLLINEFYNNKEIHFVISPIKRDYYSTIPHSKRKFIVFKTYSIIQQFLEFKDKFKPRRILIIASGGDPNFYKLLGDYKSWLSEAGEIEILLENFTLDANSFKQVSQFENLCKLQLSKVKLPNIDLINHPNLKQLITLAHDTFDWSNNKLPANLNRLDVSWNENIDPTTIQIPNNVSELYLNKSNIHHLSSFDFSNLSILMMTYNKIAELDFSQLGKELHTLDLSNNFISKLENCQNFPESLQNLNLSFNLLSNTSFEAWPSCLTSLNLSGNFHLENSILSKINSVETLDLSLTNVELNELTRFPLKLKNLKFSNNKPVSNVKFPNGLVKLDLSECKIENLNCILPGSLKELLLSGNNLNQIDLSYLQNLEKLDLYKNDIVDLSMDIPKKLKILDLRLNPVQHLKSSSPIFKFDNNIEILNLNQCAIDKIDMDIQLPKKLKQLNLSENALSGLFIVPSSFVRLQKLNLSSNEIRDIGIIRGNVCNLHELDLTNNQILKIKGAKNKVTVDKFYDKLCDDLSIPNINRKFNINSVHTW